MVLVLNLRSYLHPAYVGCLTGVQVKTENIRCGIEEYESAKA
jgi:hypothetical protein